ncbi:unannotated protein [freshwater metagenome]|uniref:Unannotated protein n=1 Tax=freshwater metagenome TaxID=449393 RepID=A0A6J6VEU9_9ZZZZ
MILGEDKHLSLSGEPTKCGSVKNAVTVAFETGAVIVGLFDNGTVAGTKSARC